MSDLPEILYCNGDYIHSFDRLRELVGSLALLPATEADVLRYEILAAARDGIVARWLARKDDPHAPHFTALADEALTDTELMDRIFNICDAGTQCMSSLRFESYVDIDPVFVLRLNNEDRIMRTSDFLPFDEVDKAAVILTFRIKKSANDRITLILKGLYHGKADENHSMSQTLDLKKSSAKINLQFDITGYLDSDAFALYHDNREVFSIKKQKIGNLKEVGQIYSVIHLCSRYGSAQAPANIKNFAARISSKTTEDLKLDLDQLRKIMLDDYGVRLKPESLASRTNIQALAIYIVNQVSNQYQKTLAPL